MKLHDILFIDIETVGQLITLKNEDSPYQQRIVELFKKKYQYQFDNSDVGETWEDVYKQNAGLAAEFSKIVSIGMGVINDEEEPGVNRLYISTLFGDEFEMLTRLKSAIDKTGASKLCAHNGIEFDFPFIHRRSMILGAPLHGYLNPFGKKPWDVAERLLDTMKIWSGTQYNHKVSVDLIAHCLGVPTPKGELDGSKIHDIYWTDPDHGKEPITKYQQGDIVALVRIFAKLMDQPVIADENIVYLTV